MVKSIIQCKCGKKNEVQTRYEIITICDLFNPLPDDKFQTLPH